MHKTLENIFMAKNSNIYALTRDEFVMPYVLGEWALQDEARLFPVSWQIVPKPIVQ